MKLNSLGVSFAALAVILAAWLAFTPFRFGSSDREPTTESTAEDQASNLKQKNMLRISPQARKNLGLISLPTKPKTYWRSLVIPGAVADRPGLSDRGVTSPAVGIVTAIDAYPGDTIQPGSQLFTLRLFSEYLQATQTQLYRAAEEIKILQAEIERLAELATSGAVPESKLIALRADRTRQQAIVQSSRQDLLTRGLLPEQIRLVEQQGAFVSTIEVLAPEPIAADNSGYEVQELNVELGQQVQAGQLLAKLSNHQSLYVVGHAFKREAGLLERAATTQLPVTIEFTEDEQSDWPPLEQTFQIRHLSNSIDLASRTLDFFIPLENQSHTYLQAGESFLVWRFRPGQRARIRVPVEKFDDVFVLPTEGVVREGPDAYVFQQVGSLFKRLSVQILHEDRLEIVIANDNSIQPGAFLAQNGAASLNRIYKSSTGNELPNNVHVHADGTVHEAH
ncbi:efflux RND transporter periplasmic adaptor subunit [Planctomycetaceae bacterium SH139]